MATFVEAVTDLDFVADMAIDPAVLEQEALEQAQLFIKYGKLEAHANRVVARKEQHVKVVRSELVKEAQQLGASNADDRESYYRTHKRHQDAKTELHEAQFVADLLKNALFALHQRKSMLETLDNMERREYFTSRSAPADIVSDYRERSTTHQRAVDRIKKRHAETKAGTTDGQPVRRRRRRG